ncbi:alpha/beta hydrolase family protein [Flocculibacter collagenilyticus]|uniref:alpha/beta hydrolase family protein n=1 Tax=Flocculibacter collagenilyticus TaxID=2744479 RepID=UPI0018F55357|nr:alpha/beta fold hydrolase [Flocculibacter collagenilyticus]
MPRNLLLACLLIFSTFPIWAKTQNWEHLFDYPTYQDAKLSPDGSKLAVAVMSQGKRSLAFLDAKTFKMLGGAKLGGKNEVGAYAWVNNERVVIKVTQKEPWLKEAQYYGELFAVNYDGKKSDMIFGYRSGEMQTGSKLKKKKAIAGWADIVDYLPEDEKHILISSTPWSGSGDRLATLYKLNVYTGVIAKRVASSPISYASFITDESGKLKLATGIDKNNEQQVFIKKDSNWSRIPTSKFGSEFYPLTIDESGDNLYTLDNFEQDLLGLFKLNLKSGEYKHVYTDPKVDVTNALSTTDGRSIYALRTDEGFPAYTLLGKKHEEAVVYKNLLGTFPGQEVSIRSRTDDGTKYIVRVSSDIEAGMFYIYDKKANKLNYLFKYYPTLDAKQLAITDPISYKATDDKLIRGYFTQAKNTKKGDIAPLVVLVHGGPHARDYWDYSSETQYLALNGYSVLQVNFRGSTGYGRSHKEAGYLNWGSTIQQDIYDGLQWAIKSGKAQKESVCIMGASFGGYSAIQNIINYPDAYQCSVANAGVYDLALMYEEGDIKQSSSGERYLEMTIGTDENQLKAMSPVNSVNKIKVPVFLAHGKKDRRVPYEHAKRLRKAFDKSGVDYTWYVKSKESHGFFDPENQKDYMKKVVSFLDKHLK